MGSSSTFRWLTKVASHGTASVFGASACFAALSTAPSSQSKQVDVGVEDVDVDVEADSDSDVVEMSYSSHSRGGTTKQPDVSPKASISQMSPTSPITVFTPNPDLEIAFDARTKNPVYAIQRLPPQPPLPDNSTDADTQRPQRGRFSFYEEQSLPAHHRSRNGYYRHSGFDRGHLAPAADYPYQYKKDTFSLSNISPQYGTFNRVLWSRLEAHIRRRSMDKQPGQLWDIYVVTGPLWLPQSVEPQTTDSSLSNRHRHLQHHADQSSPPPTHFTFGKRLQQQIQSQQNQRPPRDYYRYSHIGFGDPPAIVQVPTHFFKVVCTVSTPSHAGTIGDKIKVPPKSSKQNPQEDTSQHVLPEKVVREIAAFVIPNSDFQPRGSNDGHHSVNLQDYLVRPSDLEAVSGLQFFPALQGRRTLNLWDSLTEKVWADFSSDTETTNDRPRGKRPSIRHFCADGGCDEVVKIRSR